MDTPTTTTTSATTITRISAAGLTVPKKRLPPPTPAHVVEASPVVRSKAEVAAIFQRLRKLDDSCGRGSNKNDRAIALITACIVEGWTKRSQIIGALVQLGLHWKSAAIQLKMGTGLNPAVSRWRLDDGHYSLLS